MSERLITLYAIVTSSSNGLVDLFLSNGLRVSVPVHTVIPLGLKQDEASPPSAPASFHEILKASHDPV